MATREQLIGALRQADTAGDTISAQRFAEMIKAIPQQDPIPAQPASPQVQAISGAVSDPAQLQAIDQRFKEAKGMGLPDTEAMRMAFQGTATGEQQRGTIEAVSTIGRGIAAEPLAGLAGIAASIPGGATPTQAIEGTRSLITGAPGVEAQRQLTAVGEAISPVTEKLSQAEEFLGEKTLEKTGSPALSAAAKTIPTALGEILGVAKIRGGARAVEKVRDISKAVPDERISSILSAAKKADVPILTTDIFPPQSFIGRSLQSLSEKLGPLGSGTARSSQQRARIEAVNGLAENIDIDTPFADTIVKSLNKKSAEKFKNAGRIRDQAISKLDEFGDFDSSQATGEIDKILAEQSKLGETANPQLISELNKFKVELGKASDFSSKADQRTQLIKKINAFSRAEDTAPTADLGKVKSALDKDLNKFAGKSDIEAAKKWREQNRVFADEYGKVKKTEIKRLLDKGEATPEIAINVLKGGKPSELRRLHSSLGEKGKIAARSALIQQALKDARFFETDINPNPDALATALNRPAFQQASKVFFSGADKKEIEGLTRLLDVTRRAQSGQAVVKTGEQLLLPGGGVALGLGVGGGALPALPTIALLTTASGIAKAYESKVFRNLLIKLSNMKKGSKIETQTLERVLPVVLAELQAAKVQQEQKEQ